MKPTAPHSSYTLDSPVVEEKDTEKIDKIAYMKLNDDCICENKELDLVYKNNVSDQRVNHCFKKVPIAFQFLKDVLDKKKEDFLFSLWSKVDGSCTEEEEQVISLTRFILTDFMANCQKHSSAHHLNNERTPFVEYVVPVFKYFSAVFNNIFFQW